MNAFKEKLMLLKLKFRAGKTKVFAFFVLLISFSFFGLSFFPIKTSANSNYINIFKTVRNITAGENNWQKTTSANSGDHLAFQLQISTNNNTTANNAVVTDNLPGQLSYASGSTKIDGNYASSDSIISNGLFIGSISPGQTKIITFEATMTSIYYYSNTSALTNYAYVKAENVNQQSDSAQIYLNNNYQAYGQTYLTLKKSVQNTNNPNGSDTDNKAAPGDTLRYTFYYTNSGNTAVYNLKIVDDLPSYTSIISADSGGIYDERTNQTTWNIGTMAANGLRSGSVSYLVKITNPPSSAVIQNAGAIRADNLPAVSSNEVRTTINPVNIAPTTYYAPAQGKAIRVVTGANNVLLNSITAALISFFSIIIIFFLTQNKKRFSCLRFNINLLIIRRKEKYLLKN
jgi:uncharacterized repeat protein (TIGR01451 family)